MLIWMSFREHMIASLYFNWNQRYAVYTGQTPGAIGVDFPRQLHGHRKIVLSLSIMDSSKVFV